MSLLMQALKKAEHAKKRVLQESPVPAHSPSNFPTIEAPEPAAQTALTIEPDNAGSARTEPVLQSPEPTTPPPIETAPSQPALSLEALTPAPEQRAPAPTEAGPRYSQPPVTPRQMAQTVMAANQKPGSNRMLTLVIAGVVIVAGCAATIYYFWQPDQKLPAKMLTAAPVLPEPKVQPATVPVPVPAPVPPAQQVEPEQKPTPIKTVNQLLQPEHSAHGARHPAQPAVEKTGTAAAVGPDGEPIQVQHNREASTINANLSRAYQLFVSGDANAARPLYQAVLHEQPNNRDALLGLAAIALRQHQNEQAASLYSRLLDLDPNDPDAIAALTSLSKGDPERSESQLKKVLAHNQQFAPALFELGNVYAQQSRWTEAQDAYFRAFASAPANANYAFNLAISLDRLGQPKLALDYYQKALALGIAAPGSFNPDTARQRAAQLQQSLNTAPTSP